MASTSRLDDLFVEAIDDWISQGRSAEQIHGVRNFFSGRGNRLPKEIKLLFLEVIGEDEVDGDPTDPNISDAFLYRQEGRNKLRAELRQLVEAL